MTWRTVSLSTLGTISDGPHATPKRETEGPYFLNIASLENGRIDLDKSDHVSESNFTIWTRHVTPQQDDLLFSYETRLGEAALMPSDVRACLGRRMALLRPDRSLIDPRFLLYLYLSPAFQSIIETHTIHGATVNRIGLATMGEWQVPLPELEEQQEIAEVLGALDDKIAINQTVVDNCESLRSTVLAGAIRFEVSTRSKLSRIASLLTRGITPAYTDGSSGVHVLNQKCVRNHTVDTSLGRRTELSKVRSEKVLIPNDVLVNSTGMGTLGRAARWTSQSITTVDSHITIVRFDPAIVDPAVAGVAVLALESEIETMAEGSTGQTELSRAMLGSLEIDLPDRSQQAALSHKIAGLDTIEATHREESCQLANLRDTLLPHLMSGRLRVKDAEKQVEEVL